MTGKLTDSEKELALGLLQNVISRKIPCRIDAFQDSYDQLIEKAKEGKVDFDHMSDDDQVGLHEIIGRRIIYLDSGYGPYSNELKTCYSIIYKLSD